MAHSPSLTNEFATQHGRIVRDGGGITPDVIGYLEINRLTYNIVATIGRLTFATRYAATHPTIPAPEHFDVTDTIFNEFKGFYRPDKV